MPFSKTAQSSSSCHSDSDAAAWVDLRQYHPKHYHRGRSGFVVLLWWLLQAVCFPLTLHSMNAARCQLLRWFGASIGRGVVIRPTARFTFPWKIRIGDYSWIGDDVVFYSIDRIDVGSHCVISQKSYLCTASHDFSDPTFDLVTAPIVIGNGAWVATDCFVAPGVQIGANAVVGARSSVFRSLPAEYVCWGSPCAPRYLRQMKGRVQL